MVSPYTFPGLKLEKLHEKVVEVCCKYHGITHNILLSGAQTRRVSNCRQMISYILFSKNYEGPQIAEIIGYKNGVGCGVYTAKNRFKTDLETNEQLRRDFRKICGQLCVNL